MATDLTTIFGTEIKVYRQPRQIERQYAGFAGSHGLTTMAMGTRGYQLVVTGIVRASTRALCQTAIDAIEAAVVLAPAADYEFYSTPFPAIVFDRFELVPDGDGKCFHFTGSWVLAQFVCYGRGIV